MNHCSTLKETSIVLWSVWQCFGCCLSPSDLTKLFCTHRENLDTKERRYCIDYIIQSLYMPSLFVKVSGSNAFKSATVRDTGELCFPDLIKCLDSQRRLWKDQSIRSPFFHLCLMSSIYSYFSFKGI